MIYLVRHGRTVFNQEGRYQGGLDSPLTPLGLGQAARVGRLLRGLIGDPSTDGFTFCGRRTGQDGPYCGEHARMAYQPQQARKRTGATDLARSLRRYI